MKAFDARRKYLDRYAADHKWTLRCSSGTSIKAAVVIPALGESGRIFRTLATIADNPSDELEHTLVICVVNNRADIDCAYRMDNILTLELLRGIIAGRAPSKERVSPEIRKNIQKIIDQGLRVAYVDASTAGRELPEGEGVGLARKIGFDRAIERIDDPGATLYSLDADTEVDDRYLATHRHALADSGAVASVCTFRHQNAETEIAQRAVDDYEIFLRHYVAGLLWARSPYGHHSIGSTFACTAGGYVTVRGMPRRKAGEDFYFLNKIAKTGCVARAHGTTVRPSARLSCRTPFGTGRTVASAGENRRKILLYDFRVFVILKKWLACVESSLETDEKRLIMAARGIDLTLSRFLEKQNFPLAWSRIRSNSRDGKMELRRFHEWFDGFRTMKLVHYLTDNRWPRLEAGQGVSVMLKLLKRSVGHVTSAAPASREKAEAVISWLIGLEDELAACRNRRSDRIRSFQD